jgi:REP element-mobilizing transposase RayT
VRYDPERHRRRSIRAGSWDYRSPAWYFITLSAEHGVCQFGEVIDGAMAPNDAGTMVAATWRDLPDHLPFITLDAAVLMPNHLHGIVRIESSPTDTLEPATRRSRTMPAIQRRAGPRPTGADPCSLGRVVQAFKSLTTARYAHGVRNAGWPPFDGRLWQRNYYEHVVRDEADRDRIRAYIASNPSNWIDDEFHPRLLPDAPLRPRNDEC